MLFTHKHTPSWPETHKHCSLSFRRCSRSLNLLFQFAVREKEGRTFFPVRAEEAGREGIEQEMLNRQQQQETCSSSKIAATTRQTKTTTTAAPATTTRTDPLRLCTVRNAHTRAHAQPEERAPIGILPTHTLIRSTIPQRSTRAIARTFSEIARPHFYVHYPKLREKRLPGLNHQQQHQCRIISNNKSI